MTKIVCKDRTFWEDHKNLKQSPTWLKRQIKWEIVLNFVAFLENLNFKSWKAVKVEIKKKGN